MQQLEHDIWAGMVDELHPTPTGVDDPDAWKKAKVGDRVRLAPNWGMRKLAKLLALAR